MKKLTSSQVHSFQKKVYTHYTVHGREFPWRKTTNAYHIWLSEMMLQQTQTDRVIEYYKKFLREYLSVKELAAASLSDIIKLWQGLGYNRRAKFLHHTAIEVVTGYNGKFPRTIEKLESLPGIGHYTARAIMAFAYNEPVVFIETNIRSVFIHEFFSVESSLQLSSRIKSRTGSYKGERVIDDKTLLPLIEQTLDAKNPREWYQALMDYGAHIKKQYPNPNRRSKQHVVQSRFKGSNREVRGGVLRALSEKPMTELQLVSELDFDKKRILISIEQLYKEDMISKKGRYYSLG